MFFPPSTKFSSELIAEIESHELCRTHPQSLPPEFVSPIALPQNSVRTSLANSRDKSCPSRSVRHRPTPGIAALSAVFSEFRREPVSSPPQPELLSFRRIPSAKARQP